MSKRVEVEIVRSTKKAHLVKAADGRECWIQKRWLGEDGTVSAKTFDRGSEDLERDNEFKKAHAEFKNSRHGVVIERETEKAIACKAVFSVSSNDDFGGERLVWFPKSQVVDGSVPGWLLFAKASDLGKDLIGGQNHFGITVETIGGIELNFDVRPSAWR